MGMKRCSSMIKEFKYSVHQPGEDIIREGERGLKFYIVISGNCSVHKNGIGVVGNLAFGKSFGEIALTQGKDLRTATVTATTEVELLSLHKSNFDFFVRDLQDVERRENFHLMAGCKLFQSWPKTKIEKMVNVCTRRVCEPGEYIFHQDDEPDFFYVVVEGTVQIVKELVIVTKNRWPSGHKQWTERRHQVIKPTNLSMLARGEFFGEADIVRNDNRTHSAVAVGRTVVICLDKREFRHLVGSGNTGISALGSENMLGTIELITGKYKGDEDLVNANRYMQQANNSTDQKKRLKKTNSLTRLASSDKIRRDMNLKSILMNEKSKSNNNSPGRRRNTSFDDNKGDNNNASNNKSPGKQTDRVEPADSPVKSEKRSVLSFAMPTASPLEQLQQQLHASSASQLAGQLSQRDPKPQKNIGVTNSNNNESFEHSIENQVIVRKNSSIRLSDVYNSTYLYITQQEQPSHHTLRTRATTAAADAVNSITTHNHSSSHTTPPCDPLASAPLKHASLLADDMNEVTLLIGETILFTTFIFNKSKRLHCAFRTRIW
eukprot:CAMPEP_0201112042 /NCGR_PEP_ID=MMETSP0812-20130820/76991_1 /ASSEMBLY_ACC=CAM_ASM_000668 /TAXON_ID=98059 /ORGANISM="Dinobryon sp., Strain UTEXLB2267" /LENGTH=546 /DNA_ID=CAMNT_0047375263 /DNA_START=69 /DNA_END=1706 /DNA_ORIENTATION=-